MANLPRWIDCWKVDSAAMYAAFLHDVSHCPDEKEVLGLAELYTIEHYPYLVEAGPKMKDVQGKLYEVPWRQCAKPPCPRCSNNEGGYRFRWYDQRWYAQYRATARRGAWQPGDDAATL